MKQKKSALGSLKSISKDELTLIKGGDAHPDDDYIIVVIDGVEYKVKINKNGDYISPPIRII